MKNLSKPHKNFTLNDVTFKDVEELLRYSKSVSKETYSFFVSWFDTNEFISVKTSGSTGKPAQIKLKKEHMINSARATGSFFKLPEDTTALLCLSPNYIAGKMMLLRALTLGWQLDMVEPSTNPLEKIEKHYDFCAMVPMQLQNSLSKILFIKKLIVGGGAVSVELIKKLQDVSTEVFATYGMTETITHIAVKKLNHIQEVTSSRPDRQTGAVERSHYKTLPNIQISKDNRGCLVIDAPNISDKQIITNDLVELISNNEFEWLGRFDSIINSGGVKLIPERIEEKLSTIIKDRFFVAGIPDERLGEKLILIIEGNVISNEERNLNPKLSNLKSNANNEIATISQAQFRNDEQDKDVISNEPDQEAGEVRNLNPQIVNLQSEIVNLKSLSKYEIPKEIYFIEKFIETETKKIQRQKTLDLIFKS